MEEQNQHLRDDVRTMRGDVEKIRYDLDQSQQRVRDLEARLQRL
jgi:DNA anti-recombination protein RmuC